MFKTKKIIAAFIFTLFYTAACSQIKIEGTVKDTLNNVWLKNATIALLKAKDSTLQNFVRTNNNGAFSFNNVLANKYIILISYPNYADFIDTFTVNNNNKNFNILPLISRQNLLQEVVVQGKVAAIRYKGDTLEFKADSFKTAANANVQDLLRKMPSITVNGKGEITAQGEKVQKVLVDGEEFFSDDPAVVTKNLRADAVDKVQVFDKKSDQATFTGIDDGEKSKTINLQLKEEAKKGYFGKIEVGSNFNEYRYGKGMVNLFKNKRKLAGYITNDNTKYESLDWNERSNYGKDMNTTTEVSDGGGIMMFSSGDDFSYGEGFPNSTSAGLHYSQKWKEDKHNSSSNYQYNNIDVYGSNSSIKQYLVIDSSLLLNNTSGTFNNQKQRHKLKSVYEWKIDSTSDLKMIASGNWGKSQNNNFNTGENLNYKNEKVNQFDRTTATNSENQSVDANISWRKRLAKKGRTLSAYTTLAANNSNSSTLLSNTTQFFKDVVTSKYINQYKTSIDKETQFSAKLSYTEPLAKNTFLELNYNYKLSNNNANKNTYEKLTPTHTDYSKFIDSLSNHFVFNTQQHTAGFNVKYNYKKINISIGSGFGKVFYSLNNLDSNKERRMDFNNFLPSVNISYAPKKQSNIRFRYSGNNGNPSFAQIQPYTNNIDPLNITSGNDKLQQSFSHNFSLNYHSYQVLKNRGMYASINYNFINNAITNSTVIDTSIGKTTNQYINTNGNYSLNGYLDFNKQIAGAYNVGLGISPSISRNVNYINNKENISENKSLNVRINSGYWGEKFITYYLGFGPTYNLSSTSLSKVKNNYWSFDANYEVNLKFKKIKLYIDVAGETTIYQKTTAFKNQDPVWVINANMRKSIDKKENWQIGLNINDILNQKQTLSRNIDGNAITQNKWQAIQRFAMLSVIYNFNKNGKPSKGW